MNRKGDLSINVIIIAVISLLVLVVLMAIFGGRMGLWQERVDEVQEQKCTDIGGQVIPSGEECPAEMTGSLYAYDDVNVGQKCCIPSTS